MKDDDAPRAPRLSRQFDLMAPRAREGIVTYTRLREDVAGGLAKVLWNASQLEDPADFEDLLEAIRVLRPRWRGAGTVMAWRHVRRGEWDAARRVLEDADAEAQRSAMHAVLMAVCLYGLEDPLWHSYARTAVDQDAYPHAAQIGNRLLAQAAATQQAALPAKADATPVRDACTSSMMWMRA